MYIFFIYTYMYIYIDLQHIYVVVSCINSPSVKLGYMDLKMPP